MLRLFILVLILRGAAAVSDDTEGNTSGDLGDDEDDNEAVGSRRVPVLESSEDGPGSDKSTANDGSGDGMLIIVIAAVSVAVLAIGSIAAVVLLRRYLNNREQGVYSVPAEQGQKAAV